MKTTNLDIYGNAPLEWSRAERLLGTDNATVERAKDVQRHADVNPLGGNELAQRVSELRTELVLG